VTGPTAFFNRTYEETLALLVEARNYIAHQEAGDQRGLPPQLRLQVSYESLRVTSRLTQVMAWLLAQKAVHAGELTLQQAATEEFALSGGSICSDPSGPEDERLPAGLRALLERSHKLYMRVSRLDEQVRRSAA
jgi:regulator of CtrA degradation